MVCQTCSGTGRLFFREYWCWISCVDCHGSGIVHCCDGLQEQPDWTENSSDRSQKKRNNPAKLKERTSAH